jgi:hypothetical protein
MNNAPEFIERKEVKSTDEKRFDSIETFRREYFPQDFVRNANDSDEVRHEIAKQSAIMIRAALLS